MIPSTWKSLSSIAKKLASDQCQRLEAHHGFFHGATKSSGTNNVLNALQLRNFSQSVAGYYHGLISSRLNIWPSIISGDHHTHRRVCASGSCGVEGRMGSQAELRLAYVRTIS